jgi:hypothetical protein
MPQVNITGKDQFDEMSRVQAIMDLNKLDTKTLTRLAELSKSEKAKGYFQNDMKFAMLKSFIK